MSDVALGLDDTVGMETGDQAVFGGVGVTVVGEIRLVGAHGGCVAQKIRPSTMLRRQRLQGGQR